MEDTAECDRVTFPMTIKRMSTSHTPRRNGKKLSILSDLHLTGNQCTLKPFSIVHRAIDRCETPTEASFLIRSVTPCHPSRKSNFSVNSPTRKPLKGRPRPIHTPTREESTFSFDQPTRTATPTLKNRPSTPISVPGHSSGMRILMLTLRRKPRYFRCVKPPSFKPSSGKRLTEAQTRPRLEELCAWEITPA